MPGDDVVTKIGDTEIEGWDEAKFTEALKATRLPAEGGHSATGELGHGGADPAVIMVIYVTMVYGPIAAFLVELFPTQIRYTSMSLPYHIGNGWFGGMLPLLATAIVASGGQHLRRALVPDRRRADDARSSARSSSARPKDAKLHS